MDHEFSEETVFEVVSGFQRSRIILTAYELDLFTALDQGERSSAETAADIHADERATDRLMNALCAMNLLDKRGDRFSNTPVAARFLSRRSPHYIGALGHWNNMWDSWSTLTEAVLHGGTVMTGPICDRDDSWLMAFISAMHWFARSRTDEVVSLIGLDGVERVLDVGGGSGAYAMACVRARDGITAEVFDLPTVVPITQRYIDEAGLADKVSTVIGDYNIDPLPAGFDLVLASSIIHSNSPRQNIELVRKTAAAARSGGRVVVQEFVMDEDRTTPPFGAIFALNMLVATESGDTYTEQEIAGWMRDAGLTGIERFDTSFGTSLIIGQKPV